MKTIILEQPGSFCLTDTPSPGPPGPGQALVQVRRIGICGTDLHAFRGRQPFFSYPRVLGHELGVEVLAVAANERGIQPGDRCAVEPYLYCGRCVACRRGKTNCCVDLQVLGVHVDGGMRETITVPVDRLHKSASLALDQLALVETLGIGAHAVERAGVEPGEWALVRGAGPIGLSVIQFARLAGAKVIVSDAQPHRLDFCRRHLGVNVTIDANGDVDGSNDMSRQLSAATGGELPTLVFDATGNPQSMHKAFDDVAHGGRLVFVGLFQGDVTFHDPHFHRREITLLASRNSTSRDFQRIIGLIEGGQLDTSPWITHRAGFDEMIRQFPTWLEPRSGTIKAMVEL